ncbi:hypothetical protein SeMB42_g07886 [Synchytrium endobioticum]|uniref:Dynein axonemal intermediate chain 4 n=1 Tax=Synchytrium endobioticum TaxID=286115 RepID=A0A507BY57_9FUNG|nr:hypothetical protein SeMB42_g07886 [Synchytrium endobioticum]TPX50327.1 hypothetical protein SeLEV6574_g00978 [Synchytrium endobioticum]
MDSKSRRREPARLDPSRSKPAAPGPALRSQRSSVASVQLDPVLHLPSSHHAKPSVMRSQQPLQGPALGSINRFTRTSHALVQGQAQAQGQILLDPHAARSIKQPPVIVYDHDGIDVTPVSLLAPVRQLPQRHRLPGTTEISIAEQSTQRESVQDALNNIESMTVGSWNTSVFAKSTAAAGAAISFNSNRYSAVSQGSKDDDSTSIVSDASDDDHDEDLSPSRLKPSDWSLLRNTRPLEPDPEQPLHIILTETDTVCLLDIPSETVSSESDEALQVKAANARYKELKLARPSSDNFVDRPTQTLNPGTKTKDVQATAARNVNADCQVNAWSIADATADNNASNDDRDGADDTGREADIDALPSADFGSSAPLGAHIQSTIIAESGTMGTRPNLASSTVAGASTVTMSTYMADDTSARASVTGTWDAASDTHQAVANAADLLSVNQDSLRSSLQTMERAVVGNNYLKRLMTYRDVADLDDDASGQQQQQRVLSSQITLGLPGSNLRSSSSLGSRTLSAGHDLPADIPSLQLLWSFRCELTRGRSVNYIAWNWQNQNVLAIAYGEAHYNPDASPGLILCWSLKNPEWPERIYPAKSPVTALDFSVSNPCLLAAGYMDGRLAVYDVRIKDPMHGMVLDSSDVPGKHRDPVWELKWIERERAVGDGNSRGEVLVSVSTDGRVVQWLIRKGLECSNLMTLKRVGEKPEGSSGSLPTRNSGFMARHSGGLCFDFHPVDNNMYIVGTEDGCLHKCSTSYHEQYLATFSGHQGPVYRVRWSPFLPSAFISCSADWTVRLWNQEAPDVPLKFQSGKEAVLDVAWCPHASTVFACVSANGRLEVWDLMFSGLDPAIIHPVLDRQLTTVSFSPTTPAVLTGDYNGAAYVYRLKSLPSLAMGGGLEEQSRRLQEVIQSKTRMNVANTSDLAPAAVV